MTITPIPVRYPEPKIWDEMSNLPADGLSADGRADKPITPRLEALTYRIIGAAMRVHNELGPGLKEAFYQRALSLEMEKAGLGYQPEHAVEVFIDQTRVGLLYLDHLVEDEIVVEEKALPHMLTNEEVAQVITYLCATGKSVGLLINFGRGRLEYRRILSPTDRSRWAERVRRYVWIPKDARSANPLPHPLTGYPLPDSRPRK